MDIVEWLRQFKLSTSDSNYNALIVNGKTEEAADEIERLRQKHKDMVSKLKWVVNEYNDLLIEHKQSLDEIERLREALQHILTHCKSDAPPNAQALILFANNALGNE